MVTAKAGRRVSPAGASAYSPLPRPDPFQILVAEHALLRQQFARALEAARRDEAGLVARRALAALGNSLRLHQRREDLALYPLCERLFGGRDGAAAVLRNGHAAIRAELADLLRHRGDNPAETLTRIEALRLHAEEHFAKEEHVLFPLTAALLSGTESTALARRLRSATRA